MESTTTRIGKNESEILDKLAKRLKISKLDFLNLATEFFKKTGIDPREEPTNPRDELQKFRSQTNKRLDQVIRFYRVDADKRFIELIKEFRQISSSLNTNQIADKDDIKTMLIKYKELEERLATAINKNLVPFINKLSEHINNLKINTNDNLQKLTEHLNEKNKIELNNTKKIKLIAKYISSDSKAERKDIKEQLS